MTWNSNFFRYTPYPGLKYLYKQVSEQDKLHDFLHIPLSEEAYSVLQARHQLLELWETFSLAVVRTFGFTLSGTSRNICCPQLPTEFMLLAKTQGD
jgi:hypothetical protein